MSTVLGPDTVSYNTIKKCVAEFQCGWRSTEDEPRSGRPSTSVTEDNVAKFEVLVLNDRRITVRYIAENLGISFGSSKTILTDPLRMKKVSARWFPRMLTPELKQNRMQISEQLLQ